MIVVVGAPAIRAGPKPGPGEPAGFAARIALAAAAAGADVELVGKIGDDPAGDEVLLGLARGGVGHRAVLRDPARRTPLGSGPPGEPESDPGTPVGALVLGEAAVAGGDGTGPSAEPVREGPAPALDPADVALGLAYLGEFRVVVVEPVSAATADAVAPAAAFAGAAIVGIVAPGTDPPDAYREATVLEAPSDDPDDAFAAFVGRFAAGIDAGALPGDAFRAAVGGGGWEPAWT